MNARAILLPLLAALAAAAVIAWHLGEGGNDYVPLTTADPCVERPLPPRAAATDLEPVAEALVLVGVQRAACMLGVPRERLVLALAREENRRALAGEIGRPEAALPAAIEAGLGHAVTRLERGGRLPRASALLPTYVDDLGLPAFAEAIVRRLPDGTVDELLPTGAILRRALAEVDVAAALRDIDDPDALQATLEAEIRRAAIAEARARLLRKVPGPLKGLFERVL